jgi:hypothetical protein
MGVSESEEKRTDWQVLLGTILKENPQILKPLAEDLGVDIVSIRRWSQGRTPHNAELALGRLVRSKHFPPGWKGAFLGAVRQSFPRFLEEADPFYDELPVKEIPSFFFMQVIRAYCFVEAPLAFRTIMTTVTQQMFSHLDADSSAQVSVQLLRCTPPDSGTFLVRSLYAPALQVSVRPSPLAANCPIFFGMESPLSDLATLLDGRLPYVFDEREIEEFPFPKTVKSLALLPIQQKARLAGCCLVSSSVPAYFNAERCKILYELGITLTFAFDQEDFYAVNQLALANFPEFSSQLAREGQYPFRVRRQKLRDHFDKMGLHPDQKQLERLAIQQLEGELITSQQEQHREQAREHSSGVEGNTKN